jgi:hypothetical protein
MEELTNLWCAEVMVVGGERSNNLYIGDDVWSSEESSNTCECEQVAAQGKAVA